MFAQAWAALPVRAAARGRQAPGRFIRQLVGVLDTYDAHSATGTNVIPVFSGLYARASNREPVAPRQRRSRHALRSDRLGSGSATHSSPKISGSAYASMRA